MAYVQKAQKVEAKIQGTAFVKATVKKLSPNIPILESSLIKEAKKLKSEILAQMDTYFLNSKGTVNMAFITRANKTGRVKQYHTAIKNVVKAKGPDSVSGIKNQKKLDEIEKAKRDAGINKGEQYFDEWIRESKKDVQSGMTGLVSISAQSLYTPFTRRVKTITDSWESRMVSPWQQDGKTLRSRWGNRVKGVKSGKIAETYWDDQDHYLRVTQSNLSNQNAMYRRMRAQISKAFDDTYMKWRLDAVEDAMEIEQKRRYSGDVYLKNDGTLISQGMYYPDITTLRPFDVVTITADDAPLFRGYPTQPQLWCRTTPVLSSQGEIVSATRAEPVEIDLGSNVRFIAGASFWDVTSATWSPYVDSFNYRIKGSVSTPPALDIISYVSGREVITRESMRLYDGAFLDTDFANGLDSLEAFTMSMVLFPNAQVSRYPILDNQEAPAPGERFSWWITDKVDFYYGDMGGSVDQMTTFAKTRPLIITSSVSGEVCRTTISYSPRHSFTNTIKAKVNSTTWLKFRLGGTYTTLDPDQYSDFSIFELNLWMRSLGADEITSMHNNLFSTYGVADDWR